MHRLIDSWYKQHPIRWLLWPLSMLYCTVIRLRRWGYHQQFLKQYQLPVPVIVVGNITVGGTGKTPFVIWLAQQLKLAGYRPGIISRGYGGKAEHFPQQVSFNSDPAVVGDEPVLICKRTQCPLVVAPDRIAAGLDLLQNNDCDLIIADDGLQHYALKRDIEIVIVDGQRRFGNHLCLPAGPLREPESRLKNVDFVVYNGGQSDADYMMTFSFQSAVNIAAPEQIKTLAAFKNQVVHAVAGIGNPVRFFEQLIQTGLSIIPHPFPDHHQFQAEDLDFNDDYPILMTEKDAVKCCHFTNKKLWSVPIDITINNKLEQTIIQKLSGSSHG